MDLLSQTYSLPSTYSLSYTLGFFRLTLAHPQWPAQLCQTNFSPLNSSFPTQKAIKSIAFCNSKTLFFLAQLGPFFLHLPFHPVFLCIAQVIVQLYYSSLTLHVVSVMGSLQCSLSYGVSPISRMPKLLSCWTPALILRPRSNAIIPWSLLWSH